MATTKLNLLEKIQLVANEIGNIEKNMQVGNGSYAYKAVSDLDVTLAVKKSETNHRILSIPIKQELINSEIVRTIKGKDNLESITYVDTVKMTVKIWDLDDTTQFIEVESFGRGIDNGDKGFGKSSTYARKYALLNAYKIATGVDPDSNKSEDMIVPKTVSEKRKNVENYFNKDTTRLQNMLGHYNVSEINDLTEKQINELYNTYNAKGKL